MKNIFYVIGAAMLLFCLTRLSGHDIKWQYRDFDKKEHQTHPKDVVVH